MSTIKQNPVSPQANNPRGGRVTIPSEEGFLEQTAEISRRWGADAVRDSDGTSLDPHTPDLGLKIYEAYFPVRGHNEFILQALDERPQMYLMSDRVVADSTLVTVDLMSTYFDQEVELNLDADPHRYWEVIDRTSGATVPLTEWTWTGDGVVTIPQAEPWHEYTVSFLAYVIWDPVEMYNHLTNDWGDKEHSIPFDVRHPRTRNFVLDTFRRWCADNPQVDVVRFTTFFYQFSLVFDQQAREKFVDWFGYGATVSPLALEQFAERTGYRLTPEDFVDQGYYNASFRVPTQRYLDYMDFVADLVTEVAKELVDIAHGAGKEAIMFLGDQWIGIEPYGDRFASVGLDAVVGSVGDGTTLRMISDIPSVRYTEGRFLPYFFPDTFFDGNDEAINEEARDNWRKARRALLRSPLDRMGYGGYLSLAAKFPEFITTVERITDEFRQIHRHIEGVKPYSGLRVAVLNAWGKVRTWQAFTVAHALYSKEAYSYYGVLEALSGLAVDVEFISFQDILDKGIDPGIDVIITGGGEGTAFSGGPWWSGPRLTALLREWVHSGGGLIGVGQPSAADFHGRFFQLADCLGVEQERGFSQSVDKYHHAVQEKHFITEDLDGAVEVGEGVASVYAISPDTKILSYERDEVQLAANECGRGRTVYLAGLPYSQANTRLLLRSLYYVARREKDLARWSSTNPACDVNFYPDAGVYCVANATDRPQKTEVFLGQGERLALELQADEIIWGRV